MAASKLEINFRRLLERCEAMASEIQENKENVSWRLEKVSYGIHQKIVFYCYLSRIWTNGRPQRSGRVCNNFSPFFHFILQYVLTLQRQAAELRETERLVLLLNAE